MRIRTARQARELRHRVYVKRGGHPEWGFVARLVQAIAVAHGASLDEAIRIWRSIGDMPLGIINDPEHMSLVVENELTKIRNGDHIA